MNAAGEVGFGGPVIIVCPDKFQGRRIIEKFVHESFVSRRFPGLHELGDVVRWYFGMPVLYNNRFVH